MCISLKKSKKSKQKAKETTPIVELEEESDNGVEKLLEKEEKLEKEPLSEAEVRRSSISYGIEDMMQASGTTIDNIVTQECFISSDCREQEVENEDKETSAKAVSEDIEKLNEETNSSSAPPLALDEEVTASPSAPPALSTTSNTTTAFPSEVFASPSRIVQYPQLQALQHEESVTEVIYKPPRLRSPEFRLSSSKLQALSLEQLQQYYYCPELSMVQQFEMEFLMNSLLETYENDPLFAALQEYYHLQSKLTMNLHDVKKFRMEASAAQEHIWVEVPITKTFSDKCGDKIEVRETVTYK